MQPHYLMQHLRFTQNLATSLVKSILALLLFMSTATILSAQVDFCPDPPIASFNPGDPIIIPVRVNGFTEIVHANGEFNYNATIMQLDSAVITPTNGATTGAVTGQVAFVWANQDSGTGGLTYPDGTAFVTYHFTALQPITNPSITHTNNFEVSNSSQQHPTITVCGDELHPNNPALETEACIRQLGSAATAGESLNFPIRFVSNSTISGFTFQVDYDPELYSYQSFNNTGQFTDLQITNLSPGVLIVSRSGSPQMLQSNTPLAIINMTALVDINRPGIAISSVAGSATVTYQSGETRNITTCMNTAFDQNIIVDFCASIPNQAYTSGSSFVVPVYVSNFNGIGWLSIPVEFDTSLLEISQIVAANSDPNFGHSYTTTETGVSIVGIEWTGQGASLPDNALLFTLEFNVKQDISQVDINIDGNSNDFFVANDFRLSIVADASYCNQYYVGGLETNVIASIQADTTNNCSPALDAELLRGWTITYVDLATAAEYSAISGPDGKAYQSLPIGSYSSYWTPPNNYANVWDICPTTDFTLSTTEQLVQIESSTNLLSSCSQLTVGISSFRLRPCFDNNHFRINYNNYGSAVAHDAYIDVTFDAAFTPNSASTPYTALGNNTYRFELGDLAINASGLIDVRGSIDCDLPVEAAVCAEATIYPFRTVCLPTNNDFLGGRLKVESECDGENVRFRIENIGDGPTGIVNFTVIEDVIIYMNQSIDLGAGEIRNFSFPANGKTYRLQADRPEFAPYLSHGLAIQEGCGTLPDGTISTGFVTGLPLLDGDTYFDRYCLKTTAAYDPNDKQAIPSGVGNQNSITANQMMDYKIRFQNTGTDTAFNIVVIDTIDVAVLDISTFRPGASSHDYHVQLHDDEIRFIFDKIELVDSTTNEPESHGYVHFSIAQQAELPEGTTIRNRAGIYFDYNEPIITNYSLQTIKSEVLISKVNSYLNDGKEVKVYPSPTDAVLYFELTDISDPVQVSIFDMLGRELIQKELNGAHPSIQLERLPAGRYGYRLLQQGQLLQTGIITKR